MRFCASPVLRCRRTIHRYTNPFRKRIDQATTEKLIYLPDISMRANTWPSLAVSDPCNVLCTRSNAYPLSFCPDWMIDRDIRDRFVWPPSPARVMNKRMASVRLVNRHHQSSSHPQIENCARRNVVVTTLYLGMVSHCHRTAACGHWRRCHNGCMNAIV